MGIVLAKKFIRQISQPFDHTQTGISLWTLEDIKERQRRAEQEAEQAVAQLGNAVPAIEDVNGTADDDEYGDMDDHALAALDLSMDIDVA